MLLYILYIRMSLYDTACEACKNIFFSKLGNEGKKVGFRTPGSQERSLLFIYEA